MDKFDVLIIGMGPAGLTAALYAQRYNLKTLVLGKSFGQTGDAVWIENYPGIKSISGAEFINQLINQVTELGVKIEFEEVTELKKEKNYFIAKTPSSEFIAKTVILAVGKRSKKLGAKGEKELLGKGVSYCTTCEGAFFKGKTTAVVGGGDAALTGALMLAQHSKKVYLIHRKDIFSGEPIWQKKVMEEPKIEILFNSEIQEFNGKEKLESVALIQKGKLKEMKIDGVFIEVGQLPNNELPKQLGIELTQNDLVKVDNEMKTNIKGAFVCGDIIDLFQLKQIIISAATGAIAAHSAFNYLKSEL
ncbi:MAG: FAD-dependent oxidoreductase [Candidatus Diapherotrites archaeon]